MEPRAPAHKPQISWRNRLLVSRFLLLSEAIGVRPNLILLRAAVLLVLTHAAAAAFVGSGPGGMYPAKVNAMRIDSMKIKTVVKLCYLITLSDVTGIVYTSNDRVSMASLSQSYY